MEAVMKQNYVELELKYCERCGGLWLRRRGMQNVYCASCVPRMAQFPVPRKARGAPRRGMGDVLEFEGRLQELMGVGTEGGNV